MLSSPDTRTQVFSVIPATPAEFLTRLEELITIHLRAMSYSESTRPQRTHLWRNSVSNDGFACVVAVSHPTCETPDLSNPYHHLAGVAYGFTGEPHSWWYSQVLRGLLDAGLEQHQAEETLRAYSELAEIHVDPAFQGAGLGKRLLQDLLGQLPQPTVMLSTPEVPNEANSAWQLYRSFGFTDVLRNFTFTADPRPFGILQRSRA